MSAQGRNEGFYVLDEFVFEAIHDPSMTLASPTNQVENEGMSVVDELVVKAVVYGLITQTEALERYALSEEEFGLWRQAVESHGEKALRVTTIQKYRQL